MATTPSLRVDPDNELAEVLFVSWDDLTPGARRRMEAFFTAPDAEPAPLTAAILRAGLRAIRKRTSFRPTYLTESEHARLHNPPARPRQPNSYDFKWEAAARNA